MLITTVQLPNDTINNYEVVIHTSKENAGISVAKEFKNIFQIHQLKMA